MKYTQRTSADCRIGSRSTPGHKYLRDSRRLNYGFGVTTITGNADTNKQTAAAADPAAVAEKHKKKKNKSDPTSDVRVGHGSKTRIENDVLSILASAILLCIRARIKGKTSIVSKRLLSNPYQ